MLSNCKNRVRTICTELALKTYTLTHSPHSYKSARWMVRVMHSKCSFAERVTSGTVDHEATTFEKPRLQKNGGRKITPKMSRADVTDNTRSQTVTTCNLI